MVDKKVYKKTYLSSIPSLGITVRHHSAGLVMPISDPRDRFFCPHHTPIKGTYSLAHGLSRFSRDTESDVICLQTSLTRRNESWSSYNNSCKKNKGNNRKNTIKNTIFPIIGEKNNRYIGLRRRLRNPNPRVKR